MQNSNCYPHVFKGARYNGASAKVVSDVFNVEIDEEIQPQVN
jgi:hypothetical protein